MSGCIKCNLCQITIDLLGDALVWTKVHLFVSTIIDSRTGLGQSFLSRSSLPSASKFVHLYPGQDVPHTIRLQAFVGLWVSGLLLLVSPYLYKNRARVESVLHSAMLQRPLFPV